jgi:uncharacterized protein YciI
VQFILIAYDGIDAGAAERRRRHRPAHLALVEQLQAEGHNLFGSAILDESGAMIGSLMVLEYDSRAALDAWLEREPYVTGKVWERIEVLPAKVAPAFEGLHR